MALADFEHKPKVYAFLQEFIRGVIGATECKFCIFEGELSGQLLQSQLSLWTEQGQGPPLSNGAKTHWEINGVNEIAVQMLFDPATVADRLPPGLRFQTLQEMAPKASLLQGYLAAHPERAGYGISVLEVARQRLVIDGREPKWPQDGAVGLWFAKVTSTSLVNESARGSANLFLLALFPDRDYVEYMRTKGHYSTFGDARLMRDESGTWHGTIQSADLRVEGACMPSTETLQKEGTGSQTFYAPRGEGDHFLVIEWSGHEDHECNGRWTISGSHPLAKAVTIGSSIYACCFRLQGKRIRSRPRNRINLLSAPDSTDVRSPRRWIKPNTINATSVISSSKFFLTRFVRERSGKPPL